MTNPRRGGPRDRGAEGRDSPLLQKELLCMTELCSKLLIRVFTKKMMIRLGQMIKTSQRSTCVDNSSFGRDSPLLARTCAELTKPSRTWGRRKKRNYGEIIVLSTKY